MKLMSKKIITVVISMLLMFGVFGSYYFINKNLKSPKINNETTSEIAKQSSKVISSKTTNNDNNSNNYSKNTSKFKKTNTLSNRIATNNRKTTISNKSQSMTTKKLKNPSTETTTANFTTRSTTITKVSTATKTTKTWETTTTTTTKTITTTTTANTKLRASGSIGMSFTCGTNGCGQYVKFEITASGGTKPYSYTINVYKNGISAGTVNNNEVYLPYSKGTYKMNYIVADSKGEKISGTETTVIS